MVTHRDLKDVPKNTGIVRSQMVSGIKTNAMNEFFEWKEPLVAQGFIQKPGIDYEETYAPGHQPKNKKTTYRHSGRKNLQIHHKDVTGPYLYGNIDLLSYLKLPPGSYENRMIRVNRHRSKRNPHI